MSNRAETQIAHVERLMDRVRAMSRFGYSDEHLTVTLAEITGALTEGGVEWDAEQIGVIPDEREPE